MQRCERFFREEFNFAMLQLKQITSGTQGDSLLEGERGRRGKEHFGFAKRYLVSFRYAFWFTINIFLKLLM